MVNRFSDFETCLKIESNPQKKYILNNIYTSYGFDVERIDFNKNNQSKQLQFKGVDVILYKDGGSLYVDEKITTKEFKGNIFIELTNGDKEGWALNKDYLTDALVFYYSNKVILIQYKVLREYLNSNLQTLKMKYKILYSDNRKENIIIPLDDLVNNLSPICKNFVKVFNTHEYDYNSLYNFSEKQLIK